MRQWNRLSWNTCEQDMSPVKNIPKNNQPPTPKKCCVVNRFQGVKIGGGGRAVDIRASATVGRGHRKNRVDFLFVICLSRQSRHELCQKISFSEKPKVWLSPGSELRQTCRISIRDQEPTWRTDTHSPGPLNPKP